MKRLNSFLIGGFVMIAGLFGCKSDVNNYFPTFPVSINIDLNSTDADLAKNGVKSYIKESNNLPEAFRTGMGGVIVLLGVDLHYYAFDLACPVELIGTTRIKPDSGTVTATCPKCGSIFDLANGIGNPRSGLAMDMKRSLKRYTITQTSTNLTYRVTN